MSQNLRNFGQAEGRLAADPVVFDNNDGSKKIKLKLIVDDNYKAADGSRSSQAIDFETFIPKTANGNLGPYAYLNKGDKVAFGYSVQTNNFVTKSGEKVYSQILKVNTVDFKETPVEKANRINRKLAAAATALATQAA
jgi:single-stranded DNA-binding protein